ncbi:NAD(P)/FAD-dependent oxidoreductase [Amorphus orientalis]|uniref:NAD/FAD-binding protein n=1 Tax=Amorphus orientalis TaxID=649198 RepID=A0AAE3VQL2_9HYPH|nr:FAD-dependent oxidoreductase [Amorphus orientalis]MDQ0316327.1 putative NAD/FAD-binding protein [Amorphus orientalis]
MNISIKDPQAARIAVIGAGISGNSAAWALCDRHDVVLYEAEGRPGGHSATVDVDYDGRTIPVDTGFIVYNDHNYPNLVSLFDELDVPSEPSNMSFAVSARGGAMEWSGNSLGSIFACKRNLVSPRFLRMLRDILRFNAGARADLAEGIAEDITLAEYLAERRFAPSFAADYLVPMGAAIWSMPADRMLDFPACALLAFFDNHRLIDRDRPEWRTVSGGSRVYVDRMLDKIRRRGEVRLATPVARIERDRDGATVIDRAGNRDRFDHVVIAAHSDQALSMLAEPSAAERDLLGAIGYRENTVYLHRDRRLMPKREAVWSSWNYLSWPSTNPSEGVAVSYWMNRLQNIDRSCPLFVTLNPPFAPEPDLTFGTYSYSHPQYDRAALAAQACLPSLQGRQRTWYAGAWCGYGFHEDGLSAGIAAAEALGGSVPWRTERISDPVFLEAAE